MDQNELIDRITKEVIQRLNQKPETHEKQKQGDIPVSSSTPRISAAELAGIIDHTLLRPEAVISQFEQLCNEAVKFKFKSVCVNSSWISFVAKKLRGTGVKICSVIGFPLGEMDTRSKAFEARNALGNGADELDMVINVGALKSGNLKLVEEDIRAIKRACRSTTILKVILETGLLTDEEKIVACEISRKVGADFVKTSTGFSGSGATVHDVALMRRIVGPAMGVKASGGIRTFDQAVALINAGANRLGCGSSVAVISGAESQGNY
ncbi:MAG: deoxyribose-phosphate aldolase [Bacteroidales bacterium]|jgi:deoxyribose-phosphate aldolase|nr:deoxyribose-phosphate aldolase [Bacteroidales bacterium]